MKIRIGRSAATIYPGGGIPVDAPLGDRGIEDGPICDDNLRPSDRQTGNYYLIYSSHDSRRGCRGKDPEVCLLSAIISIITYRAMHSPSSTGESRALHPSISDEHCPVVSHQSIQDC